MGQEHQSLDTSEGHCCRDGFCPGFLFLSSDNTDMDHVEDRRCACDGCCDCFSAGAQTCIGTAGTVRAEEDRRSLDKINSEIVRAVYEMGKVKTGALIVMEKQVILNEYERTGIPIDAQISSQLLMNIFEHNTPLHDGAVFIRNQRIVAATCYLPLSDNMELSKELGTRHRAGVGISEVSDSLTIIVSEETGAVSIAEGGLLKRDVGQDELKKKLSEITQGIEEGKRKKLMGRIKNERKTDA